MLTKIRPGNRYRNAKRRTIYQVFEIGDSSEDLKTFVCYVSVPTKNNAIAHWCGLFCLRLATHLLQERPWFRPPNLFCEKFEELKR